MFGKIIEINDNKLRMVNTKGEAETNILNYHVVFIEADRKIVGEIVGISETEISVLLVGEIRNEIFNSGIIKKPSVKASCRIITKSELELIIGSQNYNDKNTLLLGKSVTYDNYNVCANVNDFFANHFSVIGNTGSGKSCGVAKILQSIFQNNNSSKPTKAHIVLFDVYGEYNSALINLNQINNIGFKSLTTSKQLSANDLVKIPPYFLEVDDLAILLNANDQDQIPIIEKALKLAYIFTSVEPTVLEYKNEIIAQSLQDILASGKSSSRIRDQIVAVLTHYHTETLNLDTIISQPGYNRTLKQCMNTDEQGKMNSVGLLVDFLTRFTRIDLEKIEFKSGFIYNLDDLYYAFEFALLSEGILSSETVYNKANVLKVRLNAIINSPNKQHFEYPEIISKDDYIKNLFTVPGGKTAQIINMNFNFVDERFAKILTKIFAKLFFNYATRLEKRATFPIHLIVEEAHRYVQSDNDIDVLGYNIFDRITKEGRKYGVLIGFITQRPSELSTTALSQCSNFIAFRMFHPADLAIISSISTNVTPETIEKLKTLSPGMAIVFGTAFKIPLLVKFDLPSPMPTSTSVNITNTWFES